MNKTKQILKIGTYIIFNMFGFIYLLMIFAIPAFFILNILINYDFYDENETYLFDYILLASLIISSPFACYFMAKIFGIFKIIDDLKISFLKRIFVVILLSAANFLMVFSGICIDKRYSDWNIMPYCAFSLIFAYFLYKFFNYLTIKYPIPFGKIGYFCSLKLFRNLIKDKSHKPIKCIIKALFKAILYFAAIFFGLVFLSEKIASFLSYIPNIFLKIFKYKETKTKFDIYFQINNYLIIFISIFVNYFIAKIFNIFKFITNLKLPFFLQSTIIVLISFLNFMVLFLNPSRNENLCYCAFSLIFAYFLYKFFNYLTIKYPIPFKKIGYFSSIEFFRDSIFKIKCRLKK